MVSEIEVNGVSRGFKFGTYAMAITCKEEGCSVTELGEKLQDPSNNLLTLLNFLYGAAVSYCKSKGVNPDFTASEVSDWLDEIGIDKAMSIITEGMKQPKNDLPPVTGAAQT